MVTPNKAQHNRYRNDLTAYYVRSILSYNPQTGTFVWKKPGRYFGKQTGCESTHGLVINIAKKIYLAHRLAWLHVTGAWPLADIDHKNGNPLDNRFRNLRDAEHRQNIRNSKRRSTNTSGYKGVSFYKPSGCWRAVIMLNYRYIHVGYYPTALGAYRAYCKKARELHGEFARFH